jgi:hypothetical protein
VRLLILYESLFCGGLTITEENTAGAHGSDSLDVEFWCSGPDSLDESIGCCDMNRFYPAYGRKTFSTSGSRV